MSDPRDDVIDLTSPFKLVNHCNLSDLIIEIDDSDESFCVESGNTKNRNKTAQQTSKKLGTNSKENTRIAIHTPVKKVGECPICCEQLGKKPVSSTKCGHVFCSECIETSLKHHKRCLNVEKC